MTRAAVACRICGNLAGHRWYELKERFFGLDESFAYFECAGCGCLQIADIPADMARYYPADYYSLKARRKAAPPATLARRIKRWRDRSAYFAPPWLRRLVAGWLLHNEKHRSLARLAPARDARILDVGCGSGRFLQDLHHLGFTRLTGIDPFLAGDLIDPDGPNVLRRHLHQLDGQQFDVIMLHHAFEHMPEPADAMRWLRRLLAPGGTVIIRVPTVDSHAWRHYRENWIQLDPPRHFYLHSRRSLEHLARESGLSLGDSHYDSNAIQFWGSEQVARGIALDSPRSFGKNRRQSLFSKRDIRAFRRQSHKLNRDRAGDQAEVG